MGRMYFILELPETATFQDVLELEALLRRIGARARKIEVKDLSPDGEADIVVWATRR